MKTALAATIAFVLLSTPSAIAQEASISVEPGLWEWSYQTIVGEAPLDKAGETCIREGENTATLKSLVDDLDNDCRLGDVVRFDEDIAFTMTCTGDIPGQAKARLSPSDKRLSLDATGFADVFGFMAPFTFKAQADHRGAC